MTTTTAPPPDLDGIGDFEQARPNDLGAEAAYLGTVVLAANGRRLLRDHPVAPADFYRPAHALIHGALTALVDRGDPLDPYTVTAELQAQGHLGRVGGPGAIHTCIQAAQVGGAAEWLAWRIRDLAQRRALIETGQRIAALGWIPDGDADAGDLAETAVDMTRTVRDAGRAAEDRPVVDMLDFLDGPDPGYDWVSPGYLERGERCIWTAGEGGGKSVLLRQIAVCIAAGILPFDGRPSEHGPRKVLVLDCENNVRQSRRHYSRLFEIAAAQRMPVRRGMFSFDLRPEGVDLTRAAGRAWLMRRVEEVQPDLLVVGPIYRLHEADPNSESDARKVTVALDQARLVSNSAMVLEAHAAKGNGQGPRPLAPVGSGLWLRWPEYGMGMRPVEDQRSAEEDRARRIIPWRGAREERAWPAFICQGQQGGWPWRSYTPVDADRFTGHSPTGALS
ncbi:AAA family ATPase [Kitasatospora sp. NPDC056181]|uniref:AAA family ATPase n=1 Tax=Kitasatospora sp. NPDC056181 TaxID=3345737 RepID=UPI0035DE87DC